MTITGGDSTSDSDDTVLSGEDAARLKAANDNTAVDDAVTDDPTGGTHEQVAAKQAANAMGDQDEANTGYNPPPGSDVPTAQNVRRYPHLFDQAVIDSFQVDDPNDSDDEADDEETSATVTSEPTFYE